MNAQQPQALGQVPPLMTGRQAAAYLGVAEQTLRKSRISGNGPKYRKIGRLVRYAVEDLAEYVEQARRSSTSQVAA